MITFLLIFNKYRSIGEEQKLIYYYFKVKYLLRVTKGSRPSFSPSAGLTVVRLHLKCLPHEYVLKISRRNKCYCLN